MDRPDTQIIQYVLPFCPQGEGAKKGTGEASVDRFHPWRENSGGLEEGKNVFFGILGVSDFDVVDQLKGHVCRQLQDSAGKARFFHRQSGCQGFSHLGGVVVKAHQVVVEGVFSFRLKKKASDVFRKGAALEMLLEEGIEPGFS